MTDSELHAECKRRFQRSRPMTDQQWDAWLADALAHGATLVLSLTDGARAEYPRKDAPRANVVPAQECQCNQI